MDDLLKGQILSNSFALATFQSAKSLRSVSGIWMHDLGRGAAHTIDLPTHSVCQGQTTGQYDNGTTSIDTVYIPFVGISLRKPTTLSSRMGDIMSGTALAKRSWAMLS